MRVLVTGAGGQVGTEAARALASAHEVIACDRAALDLADPDRIRAAMREARPQAVVNAAAYTAVDRAESDVDAAMAVNARGPAILAEECRRAGAVLVHYSTDYVFDGTKDAPYVEADAVAPVNAYGRTKLEGERAIAASGCDHVILRTSWVYGPHGGNFLRTMLRLGAERDELRIVADQHGAPTSSIALGRLTQRLLVNEAGPLRDAPGLYHATAAGATTWFGFAQAIFAGRPRAPRLVPIATADFPTPAKRPANSRLDNGKLRAAFGLALEGWEDGLREVLEALARAGR